MGFSGLAAIGPGAYFLMPYIEYDELHATCSDCGRDFPSEEALEAHRADVHRPVEETPIRRRSSVPHAMTTCAECGTRFPSRTELAHHRSMAHPKAGTESAAL
jgi:Zinc finger, C2H2 type